VKQYFVTGTDTGVGKTTVACAILAAARARGLHVEASKPVETGCSIDEEGWRHPPDGMALLHAVTGKPGGEPDGVFLYQAPLAPSVAAELEHRPIALPLIERWIRGLRSRTPDLLLVEGAGGLLVPLTDELDMAGLAAALELPLLVVARDSLGTINHTLLTLEAAARRSLPVAGVILSASAAGTARRDAERNALEISRRGGAPVLGILPHQDDLSPAALGRAAEAALDLAALLP
jgi:dethiobiotin synthetase